MFTYKKITRANDLRRTHDRMFSKYARSISGGCSLYALVEACLVNLKLP